jgi:hypothetical protein
MPDLVYPQKHRPRQDLTAKGVALAYFRCGSPVFQVDESTTTARATRHSHPDDGRKHARIQCLDLPSLSTLERLLDVDVKHADRNGFDTVAANAFVILPQTPMVYTASGGLQPYFDPAGRESRNTEGNRG